MVVGSLCGSDEDVMKKIRQFVKMELSGWTAPEVCWLLIATTVILGLSLYWQDSLVGIVSSLTGVWCVILTGKGKVSNFLFGIVNVVLYAYISYHARYYGEVMLNLIYYLPCSVIGLFVWNKNVDKSTCEVVKETMPPQIGVMVYSATVIGVIVYGLILKSLGGQLPFVDSISTVLSVVAQILCLKRYAEQWILWIVIDAVAVVMWGYHFWNGGESVATLLMWSVYLINAIIMYRKWHKEVRE